MNPQELLTNTQSSVCQPEVLQAFETLKEYRQQQKSDGKELDENRAKLKENELRNEGYV